MHMVNGATGKRSRIAGAVRVFLLRNTALFEQRRIHPVEIQCAQLRQRQIADVTTAEIAVPPVAGERRRAKAWRLGWWSIQ